jgi:hypothetical protein
LGLGGARLWLLAQQWLDLRRVGGAQGKQHTINRGRGPGDGEAGGVVKLRRPVFRLHGEEQHAVDLAGFRANRPVRPDVGQGVLFGKDLHAGVGGQRLGRTLETCVASGLDAYDKVYLAERPELFLKALPGTARGPGQPIAVRADSDWDVPEPELVVVADRRGEIVAYMIGDDVSSRSIEGENPLYLPQAKLYRGSCALGPCLVPVSEAPEPAGMEITLAIVWVPDVGSPHATCAYSWINPLSRSRRPTCPLGGGCGG